MNRVIFYLSLMCLLAVEMHAQTVQGKIIDHTSEEPLIGATIIEQGTSNGTITNFDGEFSLQLESTPATLLISYLGYEQRSIPITPSSSPNIGTIFLVSSAFGLNEVTITGVMDIVKDRHTPVAVSTINSSEIQSKTVGNVELPEAAKSTPSIYVSNQASGYGDAEVWTRGFDQTNTAFLLNGQPINGMEDGKIYWSNWSGLSEVASAIQIQRGLGASKLAISSVGGTWNFIMKATEAEQGGSVSTTIGSNNYNKAGASYSTGLIDDKWGVSALASVWSGDGWAHGTSGRGQTYFISAGYKPNAQHSLNFLITGAPQEHDQKYMSSISNYYNSDNKLDPRYNSNWGIYDGKNISERTNYYHKPVLNLNWDWTINTTSSLSTVLYGSLGRGGGTGGQGGPLHRTQSGQINFDATAADPTSNYLLRTSVNNHNWFGGVLNYENALTSHLHLSVGTDLRRYYGDHFSQIARFMGQNGYDQPGIPAYPQGYTIQKEMGTNPWTALFDYARPGERITYNSAETIRYAGLFGQLEFTDDKFSAYVQGALSTQDHVRHELFYETKTNMDSEKVVNNGYNVKLGLSYALNENHLFFANAGIYSRQPFHDVVFESNSNTVNPNTFNEEITGFELGYKWMTHNFFANVNIYRTAWNNRIEYHILDVQPDGTVWLSNNQSYVALGMDPYELFFQNQLHNGLEIDLGYTLGKHLKFNGFTSIGNWEIVGEKEVELYDGVAVLEKINDYVISGENIKVGNAPQFTLGIGASWEVFNNFRTEANYLYYDNLYSGNGGIKLPSYGVLDFHLRYSFPQINGHELQVIGNIYNLLDQLYISRASSSIAAGNNDSENWNGIHKDNIVMFGKTRTANLTLRYSF